MGIAGRAKAELKSINTVTQFQTMDQGAKGAGGTDFNWISGNWFPMH
jgi:hypothetical protein